MNPLVSVIVPVYNTQEYLEHCIFSLLNQSCANIEVILVDDGSTDDSGAICDNFVAKYEHVVSVHKENGGLISARKAGIEKATGDYITFVDSDDWIEADFIRGLMEGLRIASDADIIIGEYVTDYGNRKIEFETRDAKLYNRYDAVLEEALTELIEGKYFSWTLCGKLYKKKLFADLARLWEIPSDYGEDLEATWKLFNLSYKIVYLPLSGYHYCMHADSMLHKPFTIKKLAFLDRLMIIIRESKRKSFRLQAALSKKFFLFATQYLIEMVRIAGNYEQYVKKYQPFLNKSFSTMTYTPTPQEERSYRIASMDYKLAVGWFREQEHEIRKACEQFILKSNKIFIYGAGFIGREMFTFLKKYGFSCNGFIVTVPQERIYLGCRVISLEEFQKDYANNGSIILAMNKSNSMEVIKRLHTIGIARYLDLGKFSLEY